MTALRRMREYRAKLKAAGKMAGAKAVNRCIAYLLAEQKTQKTTV